MDENIINLGINGATNLTVNRTQSPDRWPFDKAGTPATANPDPATAAGGSAGLYFFMRLAESSERAAGKAPEGWDNVLKSIANCETDDNTTRLIGFVSIQIRIMYRLMLKKSGLISYFINAISFN